MPAEWWSAPAERKKEIAVELRDRVSEILGSNGGTSWRSATEELAEALDFEGWAIWLPAADGTLRNRYFGARVDMQLFEKQTREITFAPGRGMPGRTIARRHTEWIPNVIRDDDFPRLRGAIRDLVRGVVSFPVFSGDTPVAVVEFYSRRELSPDPDTTKLFDELSRTMGEYAYKLTS